MNPLIQGKSGTTPVMSRNAFRTNQVTNEDDPQSDPRPEAGIFGNQMMRKSGQKDRRVMVTGVTEQTRNGQEDRREMVTGVQRESLCGRDMVRGVQREGVCANVTWWQELTKKSHTAPPVYPQGSRKRTSPPVNRISAVRTPLRRSKQTKFCWPSNSWQITTILRTFTITSTEFANCQTQ